MGGEGRDKANREIYEKKPRAVALRPIYGTS